MKFNVVIFTQTRENYGAHAWDGKGQCPQYWKCKGGSEYRHPVALDLSEVQDRAKVALLVEELKVAVGRCDDYYEEWMIDWELLPVGELTPSEKEQMSFEGRVVYPAKAPHKLAQQYAV